ncbi:hypothetical protein CIW49_13600 [Mycolicibacterium sp. P1-18]|uniref:hypothetical protein n=1 Tax=Mycolicibacterium sp. P1-18 TaxID=2024615 RepID=UPI0011F2C688|nr:hypothetical protein [Mycolicibacterium sp. P1-18]KAA0098906.1 hypothetical protein CIW49_13600 [Mycolicibacterium sp. P1-18]
MEEAISASSDDAWRAAGVDSWNVASWSKILSQAGLGPENVNRWRSAALNTSTLPLIAPFLSDIVGFDDVLAALDTWGSQPTGWRIPRAEEFLRVLETGIGIDELVRLRHEGVGRDALLLWSDSGVPPADWKDWITLEVPPAAAAKFLARDVDPITAQRWLTAGLSPAQTIESIDQSTDLDAVREWVTAGVSPPDTAAFLGAGASVDEAREWIASDVPTSDAVDFIRAQVPLQTAQEWSRCTDLAARDVIDFIEKGVSHEQALDFEARGIDSGQVTRTETGLDLDLYPWQEDPADQLPKVIAPGAVNITLWTTALGGDPVAHDVAFNWDGGCVASWYEDISDVNGGLSVMSSSPVYGVLAWPDGKDVLLTYNWGDLGLEGHDRIPDLAPMNEGDATDPTQWLRLADALIDFVLLDLGSGNRDREHVGAYLDTVDDRVLDLEEMFRAYVESGAVTSQQDFGAWVEEVTALGRYELLDDY